MENAAGLNDAERGHWSARLPAAWRPYARLSRLDRPAGWRLLLAPCLMGLAIAYVGRPLDWEAGRLALLFLVGAVAARGAGCTYNDILDRDIDAAVARTRSRPLPAGEVSLKAAWGWIAAQVAVGLLVLALLPRVAALVSLAAVPLVAAYPLMKRITWWPQAWLGLCFSWGALVAGAAVEGYLSPAILALFAGAALWVIGYDTLYARQDMEDDALVGVRSTARLFGENWRSAVALFFVLAVALWGTAAALAGPPATTFVGLALVLALMLRGVLLREATPEAALHEFRRHSTYGFLAALVFALDPLWRALP